jgi:cell division protein FtsN
MKKKKKDLFWPLVVVFSLFSFGFSYFIFQQLTSSVDTKEIKTTKSVIVKEPENNEDGDKTIIIGDGQGEPTPDPNVIVTPEPSVTSSVLISSTPSVAISSTPSISSTPIVSSTPSSVVPTPKPVLVPSVTPTIKPTPTPVKVKVSSYKVRVGSFDSKSEAEKKAKELEGMGYDAVVIDEPEGSYIQLGAFKEQDRAVSLAEEVSQKGYSVIIRQIED